MALKLYSIFIGFNEVGSVYAENRDEAIELYAAYEHMTVEDVEYEHQQYGITAKEANYEGERCGRD
jgi:hypothetical protein